MKIVVINDCGQCPHLMETPYEAPHDLPKCFLTKRVFTRKEVNEKKVLIPEWCPMSNSGVLPKHNPKD